MSLSSIGFWINKHLNFKVGIISGILAGSIIYYTNYQYGYIVALGAFIGVFSVHYFLNTPNPLANTLWQACLNLIIFFATSLAYHKELERKNKWVRLIISSKKRVDREFFNTEKQQISEIEDL